MAPRAPGPEERCHRAGAGAGAARTGGTAAAGALGRGRLGPRGGARLGCGWGGSRSAGAEDGQGPPPPRCPPPWGHASSLGGTACRPHLLPGSSQTESPPDAHPTASVPPWAPAAVLLPCVPCPLHPLPTAPPAPLCVPSPPQAWQCCISGFLARGPGPGEPRPTEHPGSSLGPQARPEEAVPCLSGWAPRGENHPLRLPAPEVARPATRGAPGSPLLQEHRECAGRGPGRREEGLGFRVPGEQGRPWVSAAPSRGRSSQGVLCPSKEPAPLAKLL